MSRYRRVRVPGGTYFFTVNLQERRRTLLVDRIADLRAAFRKAHASRPFTVIAIVVLPDHLHCLWRLPPGDADNATRWRHIKSSFSRTIPRDEWMTSRRRAKGERGVWQRRYWEHLVTDENDLQRHADYIHYNPVKHGYVARAADWPCSSIHRWIRAGHMTTDWAAPVAADMAAAGESRRAGLDPRGELPDP
jgi:putative transposase